MVEKVRIKETKPLNTRNERTFIIKSMTPMERCYALFSGGFDSSLAIIKYLHEQPKIRLTPVFFNYGQKSYEWEKQAVMMLTERFNLLAARFSSAVEDAILVNIGNGNRTNSTLFSWSESSILEGRLDFNEQAGLQNRNMILLACLVSMIVANHEGVTTKTNAHIITGFTNSYYDTSGGFVDSFNQLLIAMKLHIDVITPLMKIDQNGPVSESKLADIASKYAESIPLKDISWSCYFPKGGKECGLCEPCQKRERLFQRLNMKRVKKIRHE